MKRHVLIALVCILALLLFSGMAAAEASQVLKLPAGTRVIEAEAFYNVKALDKVVLPEGTAEILDKAFANSSVKEVTFASTITYIAENAFDGCVKFKVSVPMGCYAYQWCVDHGYIDSPVETPAEDFTYETINGLFARITKYNGSASTVVIPEEIDDYIIQKISNRAFYKNTSVEYITVPDSVIEIEYQAFLGCTALKGIDLGSGLEKIGDDAFNGCTSLTGVNFPETLTATGKNLFKNCTNLAYFDYPLNWQTAGVSTLEGCPRITTLEIPEGATQVPANAFRYCNNLTDIHFSSTVKVIKDNAFANCAGLTSVEIPGTVETLGGFNECKNLKDVTLNNGVQTISGSAFENCTALTHFDAPDSLISIYNSAFSKCTGLEYFNMKEGLETIGRSAFSGCVKLQKALLPDSVKTLGREAYKGCENLSEFHYPMSLTTIDYSNVYGYYESYIFTDCKKLREIIVPEGVTTIPACLFDRANYVRRFSLPSTLKTIERNAFSRCTAITTIDFPEGLEIVGRGAFYCCTYLENALLPDSVSIIGREAFRGCENLKQFNYPKSLTEIDFENIYGRYDSYIFTDCKALNQIIIPEGITNIPMCVFDHANYLNSIVLPSTITTVGRNAFAYCTAIKSIDLPYGLETIGRYSFIGCTSLEAINLPDTVISIGREAFRNCESISEFHYPMSLRETYRPDAYGNTNSSSIFQGCKALQSITVPYGVKVIPAYLFHNADYIESIELPPTIETIEEGAFKGCKLVERLYLSENVTSIGNNAFSNCPALTVWTEYGCYALKYCKDNSIPYYYLSPDGVSWPSGTLYRGDGFALYGYARASVNLTNVTATIWDSNGGIAQQVSVDPQTTDYSLAGTVDANLIFGNLALGSYRYTLSAKTELSEETWIDSRFTIVPPPLRMYIEGLCAPSGYVSAENMVALSGSIHSNYSITKVIYEVTELSQNTSVQRIEQSPGTNTVSLAASGIDLLSLQYGEFNLRITAYANNETRTLVNQDFVLGDISVPEGVDVGSSKVLEFIGNEKNRLLFTNYDADYTYRAVKQLPIEQQFLLALRTNSDKLTGQIKDFIIYNATGELKDSYLIKIYKKEIVDYLASQGLVYQENNTIAKIMASELGINPEMLDKIAGSFIRFNMIRLDYLINDASEETVPEDMRRVYEVVNQKLSQYKWALDTVDDIEKMGKELSEMSQDYAAAIAALKDLEVSNSKYKDLYKEDKAFQDAVKELKQEYLSRFSKKFNKLFDDAAKKAASAGTQKIAKYVLEGISGGAYTAYKITSFALDTLGEYAGLYSDVDNLLDYQNKCAMYGAAYDAYIDAFDNCHNGDLSEAAIGRLMRTFEYARTAGIRAIDKARKMNIEGIIDSDLVQKRRGLEKLKIA